MNTIKTMKKCRRCHTEYENIEENFNKDKSRKDGFHPYCRTCRKEEMHVNYRLKNPIKKNYCIDCGFDISDMHVQQLRCNGCVTIKERNRKKEYAIKNKNNIEYKRRKRALSKIWRLKNPEKYKASMKRNNNKRKKDEL